MGMEVGEIGAVFEKIWDLHDKLSDAIHSISRAHFLNTVKDLAPKSREFHCERRNGDDSEDKTGDGFVLVKEFQVDEEECAVQEAKSLHAIRTALENLEDQLEFYHTVQTQQRIERDSAIARLEESRIVLAMRLAEHQGKKHNVIEEAQALVGDVRDPGQFVPPEHPLCALQKDKRPNAIANFMLSSFNIISKPLKLDISLEIVGNAALFALSMLALFHVNQLGCKAEEFTLDLSVVRDSRKMRKSSNMLGSSSSVDNSNPLDVTLARG